MVNGYTAEGDYDVILAWNTGNLPTERSFVVSQLDERNPENPFVVNYQDINIDRFVIEGQEFNIGHATPDGFRKFHVDPVLSGIAFRDESILQPVVAVCGFYYGEVLLDRHGAAASIKELLSTFPSSLKRESLRLLHINRGDLAAVLTLGERGDWIPYFRDLTRIVRVILLAMFTSREVYYPGDKWVLASLKRFSIDGRAAELWERIWQSTASPAERTAAADSLAELAESHLAHSS